MMDAELQPLCHRALDPFSGPSDGASVGCSRFFCQEKTGRTMQAYTHNALLTSALNLLYMSGHALPFPSDNKEAPRYCNACCMMALG